MKKLVIILGIFILGSITLFGCQGSSNNQTTDSSIASDNQTSSDQAVAEQGIIELNADLSIEEALSVVSQDGQNPEVEVTTNWSEYVSGWDLPAGSVDEQKAWLIQKEKDQLDFLILQFDPNDEDEGEVYQNLTAIRQSLEETGEIPLDSLRVDAASLPDNLESNPFVSSVQQIDESTTATTDAKALMAASPSLLATLNPSLCDSSQSPACDVIEDGETVPDHGSIQIWETGSLQKFKLDDQAVEWFDAHGGGVEVKTVISDGSSTRDNFKCGNEWNTNLAGTKNEGDTTDGVKGKNVYRDTEAFDWYTNPSETICAIGHLEAKKLKKDKLYWTWRTFDSFKKDNNPEITAQWAPTDQVGLCLEAPALLLCSIGDIAWCRCTRPDMPIEFLIQYKYQDYPETKVKWLKQPAVINGVDDIDSHIASSSSSDSATATESDGSDVPSSVSSSNTDSTDITTSPVTSYLPDYVDTQINGDTPTSAEIMVPILSLLLDDDD